MSTTKQTTDKLWGPWTPQELAKRVKAGVKEYKKIPGIMKSGPAYLQMVCDYIDAVANAERDGKHLVWHGTQMNTEVYYAMDIVPCFNEMYSVVFSMMGGPIREIYDLSVAHGLPSEVCAFNRSMDGMLQAGIAPKGTMATWHGSSCDITPMSLKYVAKSQKIPTFFMDRPYKMFSDHRLAYWRKQNEEFIAFCEQVTGKKMDYDRLKEAIDLSYEATKLCLEIESLVWQVPCPMSWEAAFGPLIAARQFGGHPVANKFLTLLRDELKKRVKKGIGAAKPERFRYVFDVSCPYFDMGLIQWMQEKWGAVVVVDNIGRFRGTAKWLIDRDDPVGNLAAKQQFIMGSQNYNPGIEHKQMIVDVCRRAKADAAIFFNNVGCRQEAAMCRILDNSLQKELGIPSVVIDCDILDKSFTPREGIEEQLGRFFEMIEDSKSYKERRNLK
jgi:benzoyl-CoA reductase/2-hydroxyglutaryl-CoA dehydratase subunit BcrC/BadD/HgdB